MKKKIGDLTLRQAVKIKDRPCIWSCKECKEKHSVDYVVCHINIEYDSDNIDLDQEIEVEDNE